MARQRTIRVDPELAYLNAKSFFQAITELVQISKATGSLELGGPLAVLQGFTAEIILKCLIAILDDGKVPVTHEIKQLFQTLPKSERDIIAQDLE